MPDGHFENMTDRERLVKDLSEPDAYPHAAEPVKRIETHTADIFLAGEFAFKVKKSVNFGFCDFSTLEKRRHFTTRELKLNRALSTGVYLGISEVRRDSGGHYSIDNDGETIEYALKMRRLASENSLEALINSGEINAEVVRGIARTVAEFHRNANAPGPGTDYWSLPTVRKAVMSNLDRMEDYAGEFVDADVRAFIRGYSDAWLLERGHLIDRRHRAGMPRECHGDLHAGNIFLERSGTGAVTVQVIDCIEFNDSLRVIDPAADVSFLLMDLRRLGRGDLGDVFLDEYVSLSGGEDIRALLPFYMSYRATVRCMANGLLAKSAQGDHRQAAVEASRRYLALAAQIAAADLPEKLLVITAGPTGTGKSTVARLLANAWGLEHFQTDVIRKELAGLDPMARSSGAQRRKLYSRDMSQGTYAEMERRAIQSLQHGRGAVMDGTYMGREYRRRPVSLGRGAGATVLIVECVSAEEVILRRLGERYESGASVSEGDAAVYAMQKHQWERVSDEEADAVARIDTGHDSERLGEHVFREAWGAALRAARPTK